MAKLAHMESEIVGRRVQKRMKQGATLFEALETAAREAAQRQKLQERLQGRERAPFDAADYGVPHLREE